MYRTCQHERKLSHLTCIFQRSRHQQHKPLYQPTLHDILCVLLVQWGFSTNMGKPLINARRETIMDLPTFQRCLGRSQRCAVPVTSFYEWHRSSKLEPGKPTLTPYCIRPPHQSDTVHQQLPVTYLAGLYDDTGDRFVILTTQSSGDFAWLHHRQPVILPSSDALQSWLDTSQVPPQNAVQALLPSYSGLVCSRMLKDLSDVAPDALAKPRTQKNIASFFAPKSSAKVEMKQENSVRNQDAAGAAEQKLGTGAKESAVESVVTESVSKVNSMKWKSLKPVTPLKKKPPSTLPSTSRATNESRQSPQKQKQKSVRDFFSKK